MRPPSAQLLSTMDESLSSVVRTAPASPPSTASAPASSRLCRRPLCAGARWPAGLPGRRRARASQRPAARCRSGCSTPRTCYRRPRTHAVHGLAARAVPLRDALSASRGARTERTGSGAGATTGRMATAARDAPYSTSRSDPDWRQQHLAAWRPVRPLAHKSTEREIRTWRFPISVQSRGDTQPRPHSCADS